MKTIRETIEKWNEMYDLVIAGAPDANNDAWKRVKEVFMLDGYTVEERMQKARSIIKTFTEEWAVLTEDDMAEDKDCKVWMKCLGGLLELSGQGDFAFYIYKGEVGILCEIDDDVIKAKSYESFNGVAFVPGYDIAVVLADYLDEIPDLTNEDIYGGYQGCWDIDVQECRHMENNEHMELNWWSNAWAKSDEFNRMFGKGGEYTWKLKERMYNGEMDEQEARKLWEEEKKHYEDPIGCDDYSFDVIF